MKLLLLPLMLACGGTKNAATEPAAETAQADAAAVAAAADQAREAATAGATNGSAAAGQGDTDVFSGSEGYAVYRALSVRDPDPQCGDVEALSATPVDSLLEVIERAQMPPWAPMRAAACLVQGHGAEVQDHLVTWVQGADTKGLALLVTDSIDALPEDVALVVAQQALAGPWADETSSRIAKSTRPALVALVEGAQK